MSLPPIPNPQINGLFYDYGSIEFKLKGQIYVGIVDIGYKHKMEVGDAMGTPQASLGGTAGVYKADNVQVTMLKPYAKLLRDALDAEAGGDGYSSVSFLGLVTYQAKGFSTVVDTLRGLRLIEEDQAHKRGPDALTEKLGFYVNRILIDGKAIFKETSNTR